MSTPMDFGNVTQQSMDDFERPKPLPPGLYSAAVANFDGGTATSEAKTPYIQFMFNIIEPGPDVDSDALEAFGDVAGRVISLKPFYLTQKAAYRLKDFLGKVCGLEVEGRSFADAVPETVGVVVQLVVTQDPDKDDPEVVYNRCVKALPA